MARAERPFETVEFDQLLSVEQTRFKLQAATQATKPAPPVKEKEKEKAPNDTPRVPKADWLPRESNI